MASRERGAGRVRSKFEWLLCGSNTPPFPSLVVPISELGLGSAKSSEEPAAGSTSMRLGAEGGVGELYGGMDD